MFLLVKIIQRQKAIQKLTTQVSSAGIVAMRVLMCETYFQQAMTLPVDLSICGPCPKEVTIKSIELTFFITNLSSLASRFFSILNISLRRSKQLY
jgi:hypothetical protein